MKRINLSEDTINADPFQQFAEWFIEASSEPECNAAVLATTTLHAFPSARVVLVKEFNANGFVFYSNYESRKAREISENPRVALVFHWSSLSRKVRVEGKVEKISREKSEAYFHSRPRESQLGAWASAQSTVLENREVLENKLALATKKFDGTEVPLPPYWGGYRVVPSAFKFWHQGTPGRLHDRFRFLKNEDMCTIERLSL